MSGRGYAAVIPGDSFTEEVVVGGVLNFLSIYNILITGRVLLSWVPQVRPVSTRVCVRVCFAARINSINAAFGGV